MRGAHPPRSDRTFASFIHGAMINIQGIDHLVLRAVNVERMLDFYCNAPGCAVGAATR